jgi:hypothetical protein
VVGLTLCLTGCSLLSPCKPGKPGKPRAYNVTVNLDPALRQGSVVVDLVAVNSSSLRVWEDYSMNKYWTEGNDMRADAEKRGDKVTISFIAGQALTNTFGVKDPRWTRWLGQRATHLLVLADLPVQTDKPGTLDPRRQVLPLDPCHWPKKTKDLVVQIQRSGLVPPPPRPPK